MARARRLRAQQRTERAHWQQTELRVQVRIAQAAKALKKTGKTAHSERLRGRLVAWQARLPRLARQVSDCRRAIAHHETYLSELTTRATKLKAGLAQLQAEHQANPDPPVCEMRMDRGLR
jgi:predicted  nucleic acid-binding Zn-ribbon protein